MGRERQTGQRIRREEQRHSRIKIANFTITIGTSLIYTREKATSQMPFDTTTSKTSRNVLAHKPTVHTMAGATVKLRSSVQDALSWDADDCLGQ